MQKSKIQKSKVQKSSKFYAQEPIKAQNVIIPHDRFLHLCDKCAKRETAPRIWQKCGGCKQRWYCSRECQLSDWRAHKEECKRLCAMMVENRENPIVKEARAKLWDWWTNSTEYIINLASESIERGKALNHPVGCCLMIEYKDMFPSKTELRTNFTWLVRSNYDLYEYAEKVNYPGLPKLGEAGQTYFLIVLNVEGINIILFNCVQEGVHYTVVKQ